MFVLVHGRYFASHQGGDTPDFMLAKTFHSEGDANREAGKRERSGTKFRVVRVMDMLFDSEDDSISGLIRAGAAVISPDTSKREHEVAWRSTFTLAQSDKKLIAELEERALGSGLKASKSSLVRAALRTLAKLEGRAFAARILSSPPMKQGRQKVTNREKVAANIREISQKRGMALNSVADEAGISRSQMYVILKAKEGGKISTIEKIAGALGVPVEDLFAC